MLSRDVEFFGVIFGRSQKLFNHKIGIRVAEPEVVISRHSNSAVMYPNGSITVVAMDIYTLAMGSTLSYVLACSRRSDSGARAKNIASERAGKNEERLGKRAILPSFFPALSLAIFLARGPLSERLEQASYVLAGVVAFHINVCIESYNFFENGMW